MRQAGWKRILPCVLLFAVLAAMPAQAETAAELEALNRQVVQLSNARQYAEAIALAERVLQARERLLGKDHPDTLTSVANLAALYRAQGRYSEAEPLYLRGLAAKERLFGKEHPDTLTAVNILGLLYRAQGRNGEAEALYKRTLAARERVLGPDHADTIASINNLAELYRGIGRYADAEPLYKRAVAGAERILGPNHPDTLTCVGNLGDLYRAQERYSEAEPLLERVAEAKERALGKDNPSTLDSISNLAKLYMDQGRYEEAEPLLTDGLKTSERVLGKDHPDTLTWLHDLATLYSNAGRHGEAEPLFLRALDANERTLGKDHPHTLSSANNLAYLYRQEGRYGEAEALYKRVAESAERAFGPDDMRVGVALSNLAELYFAEGDWTRAAAVWRRSAAAIERRMRRGVDELGSAPTGNTKSDAERQGDHFQALVKTASRLTPAGRLPDSGLSEEMFQIAQWSTGTEAARSLAQMAARGASGNPQLASLVRERQDLVADWQRLDALRNKALAQTPDKRNAAAEAADLARLAAIDARLSEIDKKLAADFPGYAALADPGPLSVEDVKAQLGPGEALVLFLDTLAIAAAPEETFVWVVTRTDIRWVRSDLGKSALAREVQALRCGLDSAAWDGVSCNELTGGQYSQADYSAGKPLPFDLARAHRLYKALFGGAEDLIEGKHLLVVPSGALTQLPFQVLVTKPPANADFKSAAWLARDHAISVLPAVSSLNALRRVAHPSAAFRPLIGFGNPLLDGPDSRYAARAKLARQKQSCSKTVRERMAALFGIRRGIAPFAKRQKLANVSDIRAQVPLPETADELCAVARDVGGDLHELRLGARATEREVKALSRAGELASYRIVHFATHGAMAGELSLGIEPGLLLTPPAEASDEDDGYLSASEIASLKLDADWVILSACNTAAGNAANAEALSGLARAFIYAQARALLVSHWSVNSSAAVKLITSAMREIAQDRSIGRAEALRRAMMALVDRGAPDDAHPAYWAPFIVVGEGAR
jgi:CHAT domain-containing protein/tetratricopeptide (TPR) repeat protein